MYEDIRSEWTYRMNEYVRSKWTYRMNEYVRSKWTYRTHEDVRSEWTQRMHEYRVSQEECEILRESVPYVKLYRHNPYTNIQS